jgi:hypothetical protein
MKTRALILAAGLLLTPMAIAQTVRPEDRNAAIKYAAVFITQAPDVLEATGALDMSTVGFDREKLPADAVKVFKLLEDTGQDSIGRLIEATRLAKCDWELPMEEGWYVLLPHLSKMRASARLLRADARRLAINGDAAASVERLAAMVRMAQHSARDHVLISSLVAAAIANIAAEEAEAQVDAGTLPAANRAALAAAFRPVLEEDAFRMKQAIRGEHRISLEWVKTKFRDDRAGQAFAEEMAGMQGSAPMPESTKSIPAMNGTQLAAAVDLLSPYYVQAIDAWDKPDAAERLELLTHRVEGGEFGPIGELLAPSLNKAKQSEQRVLGRVKAAIEKLEAK